MKTFGNRKFYSLPDEYDGKEEKYRTKKCDDTEKLIKYIDENVIGKNITFTGPFGQRKVVYCDYTASGRSLKFIEEFIRNEVLPCYGNTHTTTTTTSLQTTLFRHEARDIFRNAVNASEQDAVIFAGHGCTGAVHKLINALNLSEAPIVFVGPCEHHSNLLPWREIRATIVRITETKEGFLDLNILEQQLQAHSGLGRQLIGCFSAASNITGILTDDIATTLLLHQYGALAFWDYAAAAPYVKLDMNPIIAGVDEKAVHKDAMFFSVHKFVGGVQTPGVLVAKKSLFRNPVPNGCGGGTVFFVSRDDHKYLQDIELREEGGTGAIVESVRAGLAIQLKESVGASNIMLREEEIVKTVLSFIRTTPELVLLGSSSLTMQRLPVFSFLVRHSRGTFIHHNFICTVLNDIFGIQARGGCACAGPYAQDLLGIDTDLAREYENILLEDRRLDNNQEHSSYEMLRPGFTRISLPYFMTDDEVSFVLEALKMVATEGWKLLPQYILNPETGEWRHRSNLTFKDRKWLGSVNYDGGCMNYNNASTEELDVEPLPKNHAELLETARNTFNKARKMAQRYPLADQRVLFNENTEKLRWFMLSSEAQDLLLGNSQNVKHDVPFDPLTYEGPSGFPPSIVPLAQASSTTVPTLLTVDCDINNSPVHFAIGGYVDPANLTPSYPAITDNSNIYPSLIPSSIASITVSDRQRHCSCSSQTEFNTSSTSSNETNENQLSEDEERIEALLSEVTKELATEIKSELREVISQVQDVLDESSNSDASDPVIAYDSAPSLPPPVVNTPMRPRAGSLSLRSAEEVAEYLVEASQKLANEMKSEIREVVTAVDVLIADDGSEIRSATISPPCLSAISRTNAFLSSPELARKMFPNKSPAIMNSPILSPLNSPLDTSNSNKLSSVETVIYNPENTDDDGIEKDSTSTTNTEEDDDDDDDSSKINKNSIINSRDSGIIINFKENNESLTEDDGIKCNRWHCPPKNIWKPTVEALQEFDMIKDGDKVMICLSGRKDSISLLHTLHQYQFYAKSKGINFLLAAATIDVGYSKCDTSLLIPYLKSLGIQYVFEENKILQERTTVSECSSISSRTKRSRLYAIARREGFNVLALAQHLDDLAENFLMSIFHNGRLTTMKANYSVKEHDLRVIRPYVYVREKALIFFVENRNIPFITENSPACFESPKELDHTKELLAQQELSNPRLFWTLRTAMNPLLSVRRTGVDSKLLNKHQKNQEFISSDIDEEK